MRFFRIFFPLAIVFCLAAGCAGEGDFFRVPRPPGDFIALQKEIDALLSAGMEYSAPVSGLRRQAVQLVDLGFDGTEEAVAFLRGQDDKPLKACFFRKNGEKYENFATIEGEGEAFESVTYADLTGDGVQEVIIGRQAGRGLPKAVSVYSVDSAAGTVSGILDEMYTGYTVFDLDLDSVGDLVLLKHELAAMTGVCEVYSYDGAALSLTASAPMSSGIESLRRVRASSLADMTPAVFVGSVYNKTDALTDIFAYDGGEFKNITLDAYTGVSTVTIRQYIVYGTDINSDGVFEIPISEQLPSSPLSKEGETHWKLSWLQFYPSGKSEKVLTTYHNFSDGWYFRVPEGWDRITVRREDRYAGERALVFSVYTGERQAPVDIFEIYTLSGDNKEDRANMPDRFQIEQLRDVIYAGRTFTLPAVYSAKYTASEDFVKENFRLVQPEWITGEMSAS